MSDIEEAVADSADFDPADKGQDYVTFTLRVPKTASVGAGIYQLKFIRPLLPIGLPEWAKDKP